MTASKDTLSTLLHNIGIITHKAKNIILCGGGRVSYYLAQNLEKSGIRVKIIEQNHKKCINLASTLPHTDVVCGDASSDAVLDREGLSDCDAIISMTGVDELNMVISMYAKKCKVPQIITKVGRISNSNGMLNDLSLGSIVSPKDQCCNNVVRYVRALKNQTGAAISVHTIADGQVEALEFRVTDTTRHIGEPLKNVKLKDNTLIASISKGYKQIIPDGDTVIEPDDIIVVVKNRHEVITKLNDIFV